MKPTINNIQQQTLFSLQELLDLSPDSKYKTIFSVIDFRPAINYLSNHGRGANGYNKGNIVRALVARQVEQIPSITDLRKRLNTDIYFAYACGFNFFDSIPSVNTLCRYHNKLTDDTSYYIMDKGYDVTRIYKTVATKYNAQAIIPLNLRNTKKPDLCFHDFKGTPQCSGGFKMVYWGYDYSFNKFRCPHASCSW